MKILCLLLAIAGISPAQTAVRIDPFSALPQAPFSGGNFSRPLVTSPGSYTVLCNDASVPCDSLVQTYTDSTVSTSCPISPIIKQVVTHGSNQCAGVSGPDGNLGFWVMPSSSPYWYSFISPTSPTGLPPASGLIPKSQYVQGPYPISANGGGGSAVQNYAISLNIQTLGGVPNNPTHDNYALIQNTVNQAAVSGICNVYVPAGIWYVSQGINIPTCVKLFGTASFGQPSSTGGPQYGSVIEAMAGFTGPQFGHNGVSPYPSNFVLYIDGSTSLIGYPGSTVTNETDTYGAQAFNLDVDCNGIANCGGLFVGHRNENSSFHDLEASNWSSYGYFDCGAGTGGSGPGGNTPCGPAGGDNGGGPDDRIQLLSFGPWITSATMPAVFLQSFNRGISDWTINNTPGPIYGMYLEAGPGFYLKSVHFEGEVNGIWNGPTSGLCATMPVTPHCNGSASILIEDVSMNGRSDGGSATGAVVINDNVGPGVYNIITYDGGGPAADTLYDVHNGIHVPISTSAYLGNYNIDYLGHPQNPNYLNFQTGEFYSQGSIVIESNAAHQFTIQNLTSPFYAHRFFADVSGNLNIDSPGLSPGNWAWSKGFAILSGIGNTSQFNGWNIQGVAGASVGVGDSAMIQNELFCGKAYWDTAATLWKFGNIGGSGFSCAWSHQNGGWGITTSNASQPGTLSNTNFLAATHFFVNN